MCAPPASLRTEELPLKAYSFTENKRKVSSRALWSDYVHAVGVSNVMAEAIYRKKERVEALLATYTSQKTERLRKQTATAHDRAQRGGVSRSIQ